MIRICGSLLSFLALAGTATCQPEVRAWGNLTGLRVEGQLLELSTSLCVAQPAMASISCTGHDRQQNRYSHQGKVQTVKVEMHAPSDLAGAGGGWTMSATEVVEDTGPGTAKLDVTFASPSSAAIGGAFLAMELPAAIFSGATAELIGAGAGSPAAVSLAPGVTAKARGVRFLSRTREIAVTFNEPTLILVRDDRRESKHNFHVLFAILTGSTKPGQTGKNTFLFKVTGQIDKKPVEITLDALRPGRIFDGLGGNFRTTMEGNDPQVIEYNLRNLRVAWGRVALPWDRWHPDESADPLAAARAGNLDSRVRVAMEMARKLAQRGIPVMVSVWHPPAWAILGKEVPHMWGHPLNPEKMARIKESITGYLVFLKEHYGVEAALFSFNESNLGIDVRQTAREHDELIRMFGPYFASRGLATKLALGDTANPNALEFLQPALNDAEAAKYIGAVAFHSWGGCTDEILAGWRAAARTLNVPLLVAEGGTDAAAWHYTAIFQEAAFALDEIDLYLRILAIAEPQSIVQWELTQDYSVLTGGGISGDHGPLRPTMRFWNLKQLGSTPPRSFSLPAACRAPNLTCAAFGNIAEGAYTIHIVNNGAERKATLTGLPASVKQIKMWVTSASQNMQEYGPIPVTAGKVEITLAAAAYTTVIGLESL